MCMLADSLVPGLRQLGEDQQSVEGDCEKGEITGADVVNNVSGPVAYHACIRVDHQQSRSRGEEHSLAYRVKHQPNLSGVMTACVLCEAESADPASVAACPKPQDDFLKEVSSPAHSSSIWPVKSRWLWSTPRHSSGAGTLLSLLTYV